MQLYSIQQFKIFVSVPTNDIQCTGVRKTSYAGPLPLPLIATDKE